MEGLAVLLGDRGSARRCLLVWASGTGALATVALLVLPSAAGLWAARASLNAVPLDLALVDASACVVVVCAGWAWLAVTVAVTEAWRGVGRGPRRSRHWPPGVRRVVLAGCGVALVSAVTTPAHADSGTAHQHAHGTGLGLLAGLPLPDRAVAPRAPSRRTGPGTVTHTVTVHPGDTLWSIAAHDLPAGAPDQAIASRWRAIYDANRRLVGPDPDLIEPGQHLHLPRKDPP
jgi:hypothetical protein